MTWLAEFEGRGLSAVTFIQDYLQLSFDGPGLSVFNPLTVGANGKSITSWQPGFRDLLCGQITKVVARVEYRREEALTLCFSDGSLLSVSLRPDDCSGPEAFSAHGFSDTPWIVG